MPGTRHAALTVSGVSAGIVLALWLSGLTKPEGRRARRPAAFASDKNSSGSHVSISSQVADKAGDAGPSFSSAFSHISPAQTSISNSGSWSSKTLELPEGVEQYPMTPRPSAARGANTMGTPGTGTPLFASPSTESPPAGATWRSYQHLNSHRLPELPRSPFEAPGSGAPKDEATRQ